MPLEKEKPYPKKHFFTMLLWVRSLLFQWHEEGEKHFSTVLLPFLMPFQPSLLSPFEDGRSFGLLSQCSQVTLKFLYLLLSIVNVCRT